MIRLLTLSLASPYSTLSLFSLLQPDAPSICSSSKPSSFPPQGLCMYSFFFFSAWTALSPDPHACLLIIIQVISSEMLSLTPSTQPQQLQHLARCLAQSDPG